MFSTRLNPTKPPAVHRSILERVGAACRELRTIEDEYSEDVPVNDQTLFIFGKHGVLGFGVPVEQGGVGDDALLLAMAAERIGREGLKLVRWFAEHVGPRVSAGSGSTTPADPKDTVDALEALLFYHRLNLSFCWAAGRIGVLADCLETVAPSCAEQLKAGAVADAAAVERMVARIAGDLEATRAITYAAADSKTDLKRHPHSRHLRLETGTLVAEAYLVSARSVEQMFEQLQSVVVGGQFLVERLPPRHRRFVHRGALRAEPDDWVESQIARFYLFE